MAVTIHRGDNIPLAPGGQAGQLIAAIPAPSIVLATRGDYHGCLPLTGRRQIYYARAVDGDLITLNFKGVVAGGVDSQGPGQLLRVEAVAVASPQSEQRLRVPSFPDTDPLASTCGQAVTFTVFLPLNPVAPTQTDIPANWPNPDYNWRVTREKFGVDNVPLGTDILLSGRTVQGVGVGPSTTTFVYVTEFVAIFSPTGQLIGYRECATGANVGGGTVLPYSICYFEQDTHSS